MLTHDRVMPRRTPVVDAQVPRLVSLKSDWIVAPALPWVDPPAQPVEQHRRGLGVRGYCAVRLAQIAGAEKGKAAASALHRRQVEGEPEPHVARIEPAARSRASIALVPWPKMSSSVKPKLVT